MIRKSSLILSLLCFASPLSTHAVNFGDRPPEDLRIAKKVQHHRGGYKSTSDHTKEFFHHVNQKRMLERDPSKARAAKVLPPSVDLRPLCIQPTFDQGNLGSCTGNALAGAISLRQVLESPDPKTAQALVKPASRIFIYYSEREKEGTIQTDSGASIGDGIQSIITIGAPPETDCPYDVSKFADKPSAIAYANAYENKDLSNLQASQIDINNNPVDKMRALLNKKIPVIPVLGIVVKQSFESQDVATTGIVPMPDATETILGGHAIHVVGYDDNEKYFICRNSWGDGWGAAGFFYLPYAYVSDPTLTDEIWGIRKVTQAILTPPPSPTPTPTPNTPPATPPVTPPVSPSNSPAPASRGDSALPEPSETVTWATVETPGAEKEAPTSTTVETPVLTETVTTTTVEAPVPTETVTPPATVEAPVPTEIVTPPATVEAPVPTETVTPAPTVDSPLPTSSGN